MLPTHTAVTEWMHQYVVTTLELERDAVALDARFDSYGLDSLEVIVMVGLLEDEFGIEVGAEDSQAVPSISGITNALLQSGKIQKG
ncbi:MAG: acyl carrier protein [Acetobacteraceae bacterium]